MFATASLMVQDREQGASVRRSGAAAPRRRFQRSNDPALTCYWRVLTLLIARWRGDLGTVLEAIEVAEKALAALPERALSDALKSSALQNLGVAELWSSRFDDARRDLEQALALARRAGRPWLEIPCLGHLGIAGPWTGLTFSEGLELSEEAVRIADARGWSEDPVIVTALATGAIALLWLGRFDEVERWLERAERTLVPDGEPGTELIVHHARGLLRLARGRFDEALAAFRAAERMQALLADEHPFALRTRARLLQTQVRHGSSWPRHKRRLPRSAMPSATPQRCASPQRSSTSRPPTRSRRWTYSAPVISGSAPAMHPSSASTEAQVLDAVAHDRLGDTRVAEASMETSPRPGRAAGDRPAIHPRARAGDPGTLTAPSHRSRRAAPDHPRRSHRLRASGPARAGGVAR